ncbi:MAG TPA: hypothetical protein VFD95_10550 [Usitatibacter sp.]|jgi:hypothetical protein|nr:hypothetical protein [Usitatibacter sp.]
MSRANKERKQTLISACACLVGGVVFGHMGYSHHVALQEARRLVREGVETTATVDRVYASGRRSRSYYVEYRYEAAGLRLAGRGETTRADYEQLEQGLRGDGGGLRPGRHGTGAAGASNTSRYPT